MQKFIEDNVDILNEDVKTGVPAHRNWVAVLYPENMINGWEDKIYRLLEVPFCYIIHDKDSIEELDDFVTTYVEYQIDDNTKDMRKEVIIDNSGKRKTHVHLMIHYSNTTTYKTALELFKSLSALGKRCVNTCQPVKSLNFMWHYFTHNTDACRKANKFVYESSERITGNNWDLGAFIALEAQTNDELLKYITGYCKRYKFLTYLDVVNAAMGGKFDAVFRKEDCPVEPFTFVKNNRGYLTEVTKSIWQKKQQKKEEENHAARSNDSTENTDDIDD